MRVRREMLKLHIRVQLHVLGVNAQDLEAAVFVRHTDVQLTVEAAEAPQGCVDGVRTVRGTDHNCVRTALHAVHQGQHLRDDAALYLAVGLVSLWRDGVDLIDEDDRRCIFLGLLECSPQVSFGLAGHFRHDLGAVDQEEERPCFVGHCFSNQRLAAAWGPIEQDATRRLHAQGLEERGVPQRQLNHLTDLRQGFLAAADVIIADVVQLLLVLTRNRLAFAMNGGVWSNDDKLARLHTHDLELHRPEAATHQEEVALASRTIGLQEVGL
mmetsp:Transcript_25997/g.65930  ORF Transcript_25997/g.65930 Transcript_25997/m.65930 type:complete len:269 (+) Transcript_25997:609-1415(+)